MYKMQLEQNPRGKLFPHETIYEKAFWHEIYFYNKK
jgi:hypothetical protein